jgi:hypothetical protein
MLKSVEYYKEDEVQTLKNFLLEVSFGVKHIFLETDFRESFPSSEFYTWEMFERALLTSHLQFEQTLLRALEVLPKLLLNERIEQTGFNGPNLEFKVAFWNDIAFRYNTKRETEGSGFGVLKKIIKKVLDFCNIILGSASS